MVRGALVTPTMALSNIAVEGCLSTCTPLLLSLFLSRRVLARGGVAGL